MRKPASMKGLEELGRVRLSQNFFLRDFLHSEIAAFHGFQNIPDDPDLAIAAGRRLCEALLEPLQATFGRLHIRSAYYRSARSTPSATKTASTAPPMRRAPPAISGTAGTPMAAWRHGLRGRALGWRITFPPRATGAGSPGGSTITCPMPASSFSRNTGPSTSAARTPRAPHHQLRCPARHPDTTGHGQPRGQPCRTTRAFPRW